MARIVLACPTRSSWIWRWRQRGLLGTVPRTLLSPLLPSALAKWPGLTTLCWAGDLGENRKSSRTESSAVFIDIPPCHELKKSLVECARPSWVAPRQLSTWRENGRNCDKETRKSRDRGRSSRALGDHARLHRASDGRSGPSPQPALRPATDRRVPCFVWPRTTQAGATVVSRVAKRAWVVAGAPCTPQQPGRVRSDQSRIVKVGAEAPDARAHRVQPKPARCQHFQLNPPLAGRPVLDSSRPSASKPTFDHLSASPIRRHLILAQAPVRDPARQPHALGARSCRSVRDCTSSRRSRTSSSSLRRRWWVSMLLGKRARGILPKFLTEAFYSRSTGSSARPTGSFSQREAPCRVVLSDSC